MRSPSAWGITPEMLPMIVTVCLSRGALVLDRIILERHCDVLLRDDREVLRLAWLTSHFQTSLKNLLDRAILDHEELRAGGRLLVCKGAPEAVQERCAAYAIDGRIEPLGHDPRPELAAGFGRLFADGFRVLAVASRDVAAQAAYGREDERDLVLRGYLAFLDPPKDSAAAAIRDLTAGGVAVKVLTGDHELVSRKVCAAVGIDAGEVLLGHEVDALDDAALAAAAERATLMARLAPGQKERVVRALVRAGACSRTSSNMSAWGRAPTSATC